MSLADSNTEVERVPLGEPAGRERWLVEHGGSSYLVLAHGDGYLVTDALCPHKQNPLVGGLVRDDSLVCPGHWYAFDLGTGACRNGAEESLKLYPVVEEDGILFAEISQPEVVPWSQRLREMAKGD